MMDGVFINADIMNMQALYIYAMTLRNIFVWLISRESKCIVN